MPKYKFQYKLNVFDINTIIFPQKRTHYNLAKNYNPLNEILFNRWKTTNFKSKLKIRQTNKLKSIDNNHNHNHHNYNQLYIYNSYKINKKKDDHKTKGIFSKLKLWIVSIFN